MRKENIFEDNAIYKMMLEIEISFWQLLTNFDISKLETIKSVRIVDVHRFVESYLKR